MKKFKFLLIFGMLAGILFVSLHADITKIESVIIEKVDQNNEYIEIDGKLNSFYRLYKGYNYKTNGDSVYVTVYSTFGLIGNKAISIRIAQNSEIKTVYIADDKDNKVIHTFH